MGAPMRSRAASVLLTLVAGSALAACGSDDSSTSSGSDRSDKSPKEILAEVSSAIAKVKSYHLEGTQTDAKDGHLTLAADVSSEGKLRGRFGNEGKQVEFVVVGNSSYIKANATFWKDQGGAEGPKIAKLLDGKWVKSPGGASSFLRGLLPKDIGYCLQRDAGTLTKGPSQTVDGKEMIVIANKGDRPGTARGALYVPAEGDALPTRLTQTGPRQARRQARPAVRRRRLRLDDDAGRHPPQRLRQAGEHHGAEGRDQPAGPAAGRDGRRAADELGVLAPALLVVGVVARERPEGLGHPPVVVRRAVVPALLVLLGPVSGARSALTCCATLSRKWRRSPSAPSATSSTTACFFLTVTAPHRPPRASRSATDSKRFSHSFDASPVKPTVSVAPDTSAAAQSISA